MEYTRYEKSIYRREKMSEFENVNVQQDVAPFVQAQAFNNYYTYSFINKSSYYAMIGPQYYAFMNRFVKNWMWWYDGYVPYFHNGEHGIPSTRIASAIVNKLAKKVVGGRIMYKNAGREEKEIKLNPTLEFISTQWAIDTDFERVIKQATQYSAAGGTALIKLNKDDKGLWAEALRFDSFIPTVNARGEIIACKCFLKFFTNLGIQDPKEDERFQGYYVVEYRHFADYTKVDGTVIKNAPVVEYAIHRQCGSVVNGEYTSQSMVEDVAFSDLPKAMRKAIGRTYPDIRFNQPVLLPFKDSLGCELVKWSEGVGGLPDLPFGESVLSNIIAHLQAWDYYFAASNTDIYTGRARVIVPKHIAGVNAGNYNSGLDSYMYTAWNTTNPEEQKPLPIQFELRSGEWTEIRNRLIQDIAINIGVNISTIASFLNDNTARTAREISTEENDTADFVNDRRAIIEKPINKILRLVTLYYGHKDRVVIRWSSAGLTNRHALAEILSMALNSSKPFISQKKAVEMFNYDDDDVQVQEEYNEIVSEMETSDYNEKDYFNDSERYIEQAGNSDRGSGNLNPIDGQE